MGGQRLGWVLVVVGGVIVAVGAAGMLASTGSSTTALGSPNPSASAATSPAGSGGPSAAPTASPPGPSPTLSTDDLIAGFLSTLATAIHDGHRTDFADQLDPVVLARYGIDQCRALLGSRDPDPAYSISTSTPAGAPAPWDYASDGLTTTVPDAIAVDAVVSDIPPGGGSPTAVSRTLHFHIVDGAVRWFTDCGTPIGASPSP